MASNFDDFFNGLGLVPRGLTDGGTSSVPTPGSQPAPRKNFTDSQMAQESGGQQFGSDGKAIVGRYPDGTTPKGDKKAYGAGQLQIETAKAAAAYLGVPYDENKFLTDRNYNLQLADGWMKRLKEKYGGDATLAKAAYHQGETTVDAAVAKYGRAGFAQGIGPLGRKYIGASTDGKSSPVSGNMTPDLSAIDMTAVQPNAAETAGMNQGAPASIADPFDIIPQLQVQSNTVDSRASAADSILTNITDGIQANDAKKQALLQQTVDAKKGISAEVQTRTQALKDRLTPIFQKREAIAQRRVDLTQMNPLEAAVRGIFDPGYNDKDLRGKDYALATQADVLGQDNAALDKLNDTLYKLVDTDYNSDASLLDLSSDNMKQDFALATQSLAMGSQILGNTVDRLRTQGAVLGAQKIARSDALEKMTPGQTNVALEQANKSGNGTAIVNGIPLTIGELQGKQNGFVDREMNIESMKMAAESGRMNLKEHYENQIIGGMSAEEIQGAIKDGGTFQGQALDLGKLGEAYTQRIQTRGQLADRAMAETAPGIVSGTVDLFRNVNNLTTSRMQNMFGSVPGDWIKFQGQSAIELQGISQGFAAANANGTGTEYAAQVYPRIQALLKAQDDATTAAVTRWSGGNKDIAAMGQAWLRGQPITSEVGIRGMISMARFGTPAGMTFGGPDAQAFKVVKSLVAQQDSSSAGDPVEKLMGGKTKDDSKLIQQIQSTIGATYNNYTMDNVIRITPQIAKLITQNGMPHPFSRVNSRDFEEAVSSGDQVGYTRLAGELGVDSITLSRALVSPNSTDWQTIAKNKGFDANKFDETTSRLVALQSQATMELLDSSSSARPGFKPSKAWISLMQNPEYQQRVSDYVNRQNNSGFASYAISSVAGSSFNTQFQTYTQMMSRALTSLDSVKAGNRIKQANSMFSDPFKRTDYILAAIPNVSDSDADKLMSVIQPLVRNQILKNPAIGPMSDLPQALGGMPGGLNKAYMDAIGNVILNQKFQDPSVEKIRSRVAIQWPDMRSMIDRIDSRSSTGSSVFDQ